LNKKLNKTILVKYSLRPRFNIMIFNPYGLLLY